MKKSSRLILLILESAHALRLPAARRSAPRSSAARRSVLAAGAALLSALPTLAGDYKRARYGEFAKMSYGGYGGDSLEDKKIGSDVGKVLYKSAYSGMTEADRAELRSKVDAVQTRWRKMAADVRQAMGKASPAYPVALSALDNNMGALKVDMRSVSKSLSGGDITVRVETLGGVDQPRFDYNTGQFELQKIVTQAEDCFTVVNGLYFDGVKARAAPTAALAKLDKADAAFDAWLRSVAGASK